jgi:F-type H+-transporting ATPase subunit b
MSLRRTTVAFVLAAALFLPALQAQEQHPPAAPPQGHGAEQIPAGSTQTEPAREHAEADPHAQFKESASVKAIARATGLSVGQAYWVSVFLNFAVIAGLAYLLMRSRLPQALRERTRAIQQNIEEARRASDEANRRLAEIEGRLARIDAEMTELRSTADREAAAEEERIRAAAEEDKQKVVRAAEQEIATAARAARSELKAYAAELAVTLAEQRIEVDPAADKALVREFVQQLGKDGQ